MGNLTNKDLQRMRNLMGNKKPINENKLVSAVELIKKSANGKIYGVVRENKKYFIKESNDGSNFDFIGGVANKSKHQFESYEQAVRRLNLMLENTDVLTPDLIEEKKFVIKTKKKSEPKSDNFDFGGDTGGGDFDFGGDSEGGEETPDFSGDSEGGEETPDFDFGGGEEETDLDLGGDDELSDEDDPIKSIQKMTGKLGQKIRDTEDLSSDTMKWVAKSVLSALDLDGMDNEDKKDLIRTIKNDEVEGSDEEIDFMDDDCPGCSGSGFDDDMENCVDCGGTGSLESDMVDWNTMSPEERVEFIQTSFPGDKEKPLMDWDEEIQAGRYDDLVELDEPYRRTGESQYMLFDPDEVDAKDDNFDYELEYASDYMEDEEELYGPGDETIEQGEELLNDELPYYEDENQQDYFGNEDWMSDDEETYPYYEVGSSQLPLQDDSQTTDYMSKFAGDVKRGLSSGGRNLERHELDTHLRKIKSKLGGRTTHIDGNMVVGSFGFVKVTNKGYELHREGERFPKTFGFDELGKLKNSLSGVDYMDYMGDVRNPAPATTPSKPTTKPDVKPGKPDTDKPNPSKRPFTPPPHITPGKEPAPKAKNKWSRTKPYDEKYVDYPYEYPEGDYDYMEDDYYGGFKNKDLWYDKNDAEITPNGSEIDEFWEEKEFSDWDRFRESEYGQDKDNKWSIHPNYKEGKTWFNNYIRTHGPLTIRSRRKTDVDKTTDLFNQAYEDYMEDEDSCPTCQGSGHMKRPIGFGGSYDTPVCMDCGGTGRNQEFVGNQENISSEDEIDEPYINNPLDYRMDTTLPNNLNVKYVYKEKFNFPFPIGDVDYMDDINDISSVNKRRMNPMNPAPSTAPTKPGTKPDVKPGKPGTDKPNPSKRPFTPPPHITPGKEPSPKARNRRF